MTRRATMTKQWTAGPWNASTRARLQRAAAGLVGGLSERDRRVLRLLAEHRVFTAEHLGVHVGVSANTMRRELRRLAELDVVGTYRPGAGAVLWYGLTDLGQAVAAVDAGRTLDAGQTRVGWWPFFLHWDVAARRMVAHGLVAALAARAADHPNARLAEWYSPERFALWWARRRRDQGELVSLPCGPDAFVVWDEDTWRISFALIVDQPDASDVYWRSWGLRLATRVLASLPAYACLELPGGQPPCLLVACADEQRERKVQAAVLAAEVPEVWTATCLLADVTRPWDAVWLPVRGSARVTLASLGQANRQRRPRPQTTPAAQQASG